MSEYILPGVYLEEVTPSGAFQLPQGSGIIGLVGKFHEGDTNVLTRCGSWDEFVEEFGELRMGGLAGYAAYFAFKNRASQIVVVNVGGTKSAVTINDRQGVPATKLKVEVLVPGTHGDYAAGPPKLGCQCVIADGTVTDTFKATFNYYYLDKATYGTYSEEYDNLSPDPAATRYFKTVINAASQVVVVDDLHPANIGAANRPAVGTYSCAAGAEPDYDGTDKGLTLLKKATDVRIVITDRDDSGGRTKQMSHCSDCGDRITVLNPPIDSSTAEVEAIGDALDDDRAVLTYPWISALDPVAEVTRTFQPAGFYAGVLARIDPYLSPSNQQVIEALDLEQELSNADLESVQESKVSPIYVWGTRGIRVRNGINCSSDANLSQIARRRMSDYILELLDTNAQFAVSQPITPDLMAAVRGSLHNAFENLRTDGWIESFSVVCDDTNNTAVTKAARKLMVRVSVKLWNVGDYVVVSAEIGENVETA